MVREKFFEAKEFMVSNAKYAVACATVTAATLVPTMTSFAADASGDSGFLDSATVSVITDSVAKMTLTITAVVAICVPAAFSIMGLTVAAKYAIKYVKNMISKAAAS